MTDKDAAAFGAIGTTQKAGAEPSRNLAAELPGDTLAEKVDALHARHFDGTALTTHTTLWNMVHAFKEDVKTLLPKA